MERISCTCCGCENFYFDRTITVYEDDQGSITEDGPHYRCDTCGKVLYEIKPPTSDGVCKHYDYGYCYVDKGVPPINCSYESCPIRVSQEESK